MCPAFTTANAIASLGDARAPSLKLPDHAAICDVACRGTLFHAPAVIWSPGRNSTRLPAMNGADEAENVDTFIPALVPADRAFVMHDAASGHQREFDDIVIWLSPTVLYNRLVSAGAL